MGAAGFDRRQHPPGAFFSNWNSADGFTLRRMDWPQPEGIAIRGSLLFAGGRGDFVEKYLEAIAHWHDAGWNIASFDWRGQGASRTVDELLPGHLDSFDPLVTDLIAMIGEWRASTPRPHVAIAHSMGGHLLLRAIAEQKLGLQAAVLVAPMIGVNATPIPAWLGSRVAAVMARRDGGRRRAWEQNERPAPAGSSREAYLTSCPERYDDELWWRSQQPSFTLGPPTWGWLDAAYRSMARLSPNVLARIEMPILLLGTERDRLVSPTAIKAAAAALPNAELFMFPDAAHELLRERDAIRLAALVRIDAFLDKHTPE